MKFAFVSLYGQLASVAYRFTVELGSENVRLLILNTKCQKTFDGLLHKAKSLVELDDFAPNFVITDYVGLSYEFKNKCVVIGAGEIYKQVNNNFELLKTLGLEVGEEAQESNIFTIEGWFDGSKFIDYFYYIKDREFLTGGLGPLTVGEGLIFWREKKRNEITQKLERFAPLLRNNYIGPISLDIQKDKKIVGLHLGLAFDSLYALLDLVKGKYSTLFYNLANQELREYGGFDLPAVAIRISVPPYPYIDEQYIAEREQLPLTLLNPSLLSHLWLQDVSINSDSRLEVWGGVAAVATSKRSTLQGAVDATYKVVEAVSLHTKQYRLDIGQQAREFLSLLIHQKVMPCPAWLRSEESLKGLQKTS
jgi:hypothetical protein